MEYTDDNDLDPVIWQCSQAVELKRIFADAPAPPPVLPETTNKSGNVNKLKRKRWQDQDTPTTSSAETLGLIQQLSRTLGSCRPTNPARRNTRVASASALMIGSNRDMPPPRRPDLTESCDEATPLSDSTSFNWSREGSSTAESSSVVGDSSSNKSMDTVRPCTPPIRNAQPAPRPATEPTITVAALIARSESPELPPPPPTKPVLSIRTSNASSLAARVDTSAFSSRSNTSESGTGSVISTTAPGPVSPITPVAPREPTPIIEISPTPSPEPSPPPKAKPKTKAKPTPVAAKSKSPSRSPSPPPKPKTKPKTRERPGSSSRATTEPAPTGCPPPIPSQQARSEPSQQFRPPTQQAFKPPTQQAFRPPTQTRAFPSSSQSRLGLGAIGNGYANINRPFKVPSKGGAPPKPTVVQLPKRGDDKGKTVVNGSPTKAGKPKPRKAQPTPRKENRGKARRDPSSDDYPSDGSFDAAAVDADMAVWDSWND